MKSLLMDQFCLECDILRGNKFYWRGVDTRRQVEVWRQSTLGGESRFGGMGVQVGE